MKTLYDIERFLGLPTEGGKLGESLLISNLSLDARVLEPGDLFIAIQGHSRHGLDYLYQAVENGVACILSDRPLDSEESRFLKGLKQPPTVEVVDNLKQRMGLLANWFYDCPSERIRVVGVTGTNGKTSSAHYLAQLLLELGQTPALIGTLGNGVIRDRRFDRLTSSLNTTPDVVSVHRRLFEYAQQGANWVVMEVSSHALALGRVEAVRFECVALTQVARDHLDFHGTEQAYREAKTRLFSDYESRFQVVNIEDDVGRSLWQSCPNALGYCASDCETVCSGGVLCCRQHTLTAQGMELALQWGEDRCAAELVLMGRFNIENLLCALGVMRVTGFDWQACCHALKNLKAVAGRMEPVLSEPSVMVDFAHTPDALEKVLQAVSAHLGERSAQLYLVFGCGGDRDRGKRPLMAAVAERYADHVVLTSDNPRYENPEAIFADVLGGFEKTREVEVVADRKQAIRTALNRAGHKDLVIVAGKGHEAYQEMEGIKQPFSDRQVILEWAQNAQVNSRETVDEAE